MRKGCRFIAVGFVLIALVAAVILAACQPTPEAQPPATPEVPQATAPPPAIGMQSGERYHEIHTTKLQLKCDFCHTNATENYYDPLAQVSNLADRRACLSCHKEGAVQPFYGENWTEAKIK